MNYRQISVDNFGTFFSKVDLGPKHRCWRWQGKVNNYGYGMWRERPAHRASYEYFIGEIPDGHQLHHACETKACVNPWHLRAVTPAAHPGNGPDVNRRKTHCKRGHPFTLENTYLRPEGRRCRTCRREAVYRSRAKAVV